MWQKSLCLKYITFNSSKQRPCIIDAYRASIKKGKRKKHLISLTIFDQHFVSVGALGTVSTDSIIFNCVSSSKTCMVTNIQTNRHLAFLQNFNTTHQFSTIYGTFLDNTILENTILDQTIIDKTILDQTILEKTILDETIHDKSIWDISNKLEKCQDFA